METNEENRIQDAEISQTVKAEDLQKENVRESIDGNDEIEKEAHAKKAKSELRSRLILTLILGFLVGIAFKAEALKKITIGYDDYLMRIKSQSFNINEIQTKLQKQIEDDAKLQEQGGNVDDSGGADDSVAPASDGAQAIPGGATNQEGN
ncbi:MAG: hypothetical protein WCO05_04795 [Candidatus Moraniibacteriota bacterium]|jgi:hypothetical protein